MCKDEYDRLVRDISEQIDQCEIGKLLDTWDKFSEFDSSLFGNRQYSIRNPYYPTRLTPSSEVLSSYPNVHDILEEYESDLKTTLSRIEKLTTLNAEKDKEVQISPIEFKNTGRRMFDSRFQSQRNSYFPQTNSDFGKDECKSLLYDLTSHCASILYKLIPTFKHMSRTEKEFTIVEPIDSHNLKVRKKSDACVYLIHKIKTIVSLDTYSGFYQATWNQEFELKCNKTLFWFHNNDSTDIGINRYVEKLSQMNHKNVVKYVTSWSETPSQPYFSSLNSSPPAKFDVFINIQTESHTSRTLNNRIEEGFKGDWEVLQIFFEIVSGLAHSHKLGITHGDLSSYNIFLDLEDHIKIGNFNVNRSLSSEVQLPFDLKCSIVPNMLTQFGLSDEKRTRTQCSYAQKSDIFSLGIILFEMFCDSSFKSRNNIGIMKSQDSTIIVNQKDLANFANERHRAIILWLLNEDPLERPTAEELLCSKDILLMKPSEINELLNFTKGNRNTESLKSLIKTISNKAISSSIKTSYATWPVASVSILHNKFESMVRLHGARQIVVPELQTEQVLETHFEIFWMNRRKEDESSFRDQRIAFAQYIANRNINAIKTYSIENTSEEADHNPTNTTIGGSFDIVTTLSGSTLMHTVEVIWVGRQLVSECPSTYIRLSHTDLLKSLLVQCEIPERHHKQIYRILQTRGEEIWTPNILEEQLRSLLGDTFSQKLYNLVSNDMVVDQLEAVFASDLGVEGIKSQLASNALREVEEIVLMLKELLNSTLDVKNMIKFHFGVVNNVRCYSGIVFQVVTTQGEILAVGGRYDKLIQFHKEQKQKRHSAVGITVALKFFSTLSPRERVCLKVSDVFVVSVGADRFVNQLKIANILWSKGISALMYDYDLHGNAESMKTFCMSHGIKYIVYCNQSGICLLAKLDSEKHAARILSKGAPDKMINLIEYEINLERTKIQNRKDSTHEKKSEKTSKYVPAVVHEKERTTDQMRHEKNKSLMTIEG